MCVQGRFLNNLVFKQSDAALSPHHRFSHGSRSPTLIYNPQRGFPHPLTPSLLNAGSTHIYVLAGKVVDYIGAHSNIHLFFSYFKQCCRQCSCEP